MKLSLIIPCCNEESVIRKFHQVTRKLLSNAKLDYELIYVDDGSTDKTFYILKELKKNNPTTIRIVKLTRNFGKEAAMLAGLQQAKGRYIGIIDADLQQHPKYILTMTNLLDRMPLIDVICAYQKKRPNEGALACIKKLFYKLMNQMAQVELMENASDFRLFRRNVAKAILQLPEYHRFSKGIFAWLGFKTIYIPYLAEKRAAGKSKWNFSKLFSYAIEGIVGYSIRPLRIATWMSLATVFASVFYLSSVIIQKIIWGIQVPGYATIVVLTLFLGSIQLLCMGLIGEYIGRIFEQSKHRPIYIVETIL